MVTTGTSTGPLKDDGEAGVGGSDIDDLAYALDGAGLERIGRLLGAGDACGNAEALDREPLATHLLPERKLEAELGRVDLQCVESDADAGGFASGFQQPCCGAQRRCSDHCQLVRHGSPR